MDGCLGEVLVGMKEWMMSMAQARAEMRAPTKANWMADKRVDSMAG